MSPTMPDPQLALRKHLLPVRLQMDRGRRQDVAKSPGSGVRNLSSTSGSRHATGVAPSPSVGLYFPICKMGSVQMLRQMRGLEVSGCPRSSGLQTRNQHGP